MTNPSPALMLAWEIAAHEAAELNQPHIEPEHFFIGLCKLEQFQAASWLRQLGYESSEAENMESEIRQFLAHIKRFGVEPVVLRREIRAKHGTSILGRLSGWTTGMLGRDSSARTPQPAPNSDGVLHRSPASHAIFERAVVLANKARTETVTSIHVLAALLEDKPSRVTTVLREHAVNVTGLHDAVLAR